MNKNEVCVNEEFPMFCRSEESINNFTEFYKYPDIFYEAICPTSPKCHQKLDEKVELIAG